MTQTLTSLIQKLVEPRLGYVEGFDESRAINHDPCEGTGKLLVWEDGQWNEVPRVN